MATDTLYYGDNLGILREHISSESVDLVYLDPPFKSNRDYNVLFEERSGSRSAAQIRAFEDTWEWDQDAARAYEEVVEAGGQVSRVMQAFRQFLGDNDMLAYLSMMAPRLVELRRVLKPTGSIYLHCDPTASAHLRLLMDAVFGPKSFCNEIVWHYRKWPSGKWTFQRNHDVILFYSRSDSRSRTFNQLFMERAPSTVKRFGMSKIISGHDEDGRRVPSRTEEEDSEGVRQDDVWDIGRVPPIKQLFPTEKPERLLERIIAASSDEGDTVLDPFCGCGTAVVVAQRLGRRWVGIDVTHLAITLIKHRLKGAFGRRPIRYEVIGVPVSTPDAEALAIQDPHQFEWWALGLVNARPTEQKRGADKGIDGRLYFHDDGSKKTKQVVLQVKGGTLGVSQVRDLRGVVEREKAEVGALISLLEPTRPMKTEAAGAGSYHAPMGTRHPRIQLLTIRGLLEGQALDLPRARREVTFKDASRSKGTGKQPRLPAQ